MAEPFTGSEVIEAIETVYGDSVEYWHSFDTQSFFEPIGESWSPSENVRHLTKSIRAVTFGLRLPKVALLLKFGKPKHESRTYSTIVDVYHKVLAAGGKAGKFTPKKREPAVDPEEQRAQIMEQHKEAVELFCDSIRKWSEKSLDTRQMPHPLIGNLTVREMILFTVYHNQHHVENVRRGTQK